MFEPSLFPADQLSYVNWVRKSLLLLGWKIRKGDSSEKKIFFDEISLAFNSRQISEGGFFVMIGKKKNK